MSKKKLLNNKELFEEAKKLDKRLREDIYNQTRNIKNVTHDKPCKISKPISDES